MFFIWQRVSRRRRVLARTILRALFPRRILHSRSNEADIGYLFFNVLVYGVMFGWAALSYQFISNGYHSGLVALFGGFTLDFASLRDPLRHHGDAVSRL